ncbi:MAG: hypothetical protein V3S26_09295 [Acidimicrobiia bacterium]
MILDLLLPTTDAGVAAQLAVVFGVLAIALWRFWSNPEIRLLVIGSGIVVLGLMGLRALH